MVAASGGFSRSDRLRRSAEFRRIQLRSRRISGSAVVILIAPEAEREWKEAPSRCRLGVTVSRRVGNAVVRNRVKRRIREWFRLERGSIAEALDIVVIARQPAALLSAAELSTILSNQLRKLGILRDVRTQ